jgi:colanic acid/amylovoran biosynthesis protein
MKIFLGGLTSSKPGGMEYHNLGNYVIAEPLFKLLRDWTADDIYTSMQMSDGFNKRFNLIKLDHRRFWVYNKYTILRSLADLLKSILIKASRALGIPYKRLVNSSHLLSVFHSCDLYIDFSGDLYGDNARAMMLIDASLKLIIAKISGLKTAVMIGSPGPFNHYWKRALVRYVFGKVDLVTNRESISTDLLLNQNFKSSNMYSTACPSVFFEKDSDANSAVYLEKENLMNNGSRYKVGLIVCGWNMPVSPHNKWPREDWEYDFFNKLIRHLIDNHGAHVYLMSHQNATDKDMNLLPGIDHKLIKKLFAMNDYANDQLSVISGLYSAAESKSIIGEFDILISGRIHGAVQGMSQLIPTMIVDYGHEPKAHKLKGFARNYAVEEYIIDPTNLEESIKRIDNLFDNKEEAYRVLKKNVSLVKERVMQNFSLLDDLKDARQDHN